MAGRDVVPQGYWMRCNCKNPNQKAFCGLMCSVCAHAKDSACADGGDQKLLPTGGFSEPTFESTSAVSNAEWSTHMTLYGTQQPHYTHSLDFGGYTPSDIPEYSDVWYCPECRAANTGLTQDFCPVCDWRADSSVAMATLPYISAPINSVPEGRTDLWVCPNSNCGAENHDWLDFCPLCGTAK
jgi:hypothetical protein